MSFLVIIFAYEIEVMNNKSIYKSKNGLDIIIRPAEVKDGTSLLNLKLGYIRNTNTIPLFEDEYRNTPEQEEALINKLCNQENSCLFVAEYNGQLIGNVDINGSQRRKLKHTAMLGIGIVEDWQGHGIGTMLMNEAIQWANTNLFLELIILDVYDSNHPGKALYNKLGFQPCGRVEGFFKENGEYIDSIRMVYRCV